MVQNIGRTQVGHIPRTIAASLAPLLDRNLVTVEGTMLDGNINARRTFTIILPVTCNILNLIHNIGGSLFSLAMYAKCIFYPLDDVERNIFHRMLKIFGASDKRDQLEPSLIWATPRQRGFPPRNNSAAYPVPGVLADDGGHGPSFASAAVTSTQQRSGMTAAQKEAAAKQHDAFRKAAELKQMLNNLEKVDDEGRRTSLLDTLCSTDDVLNLPLHPDPPGIKNGNLQVDLLKHQVRVL